MKRLLIVDQSDFVNNPVGGSTTFLRTIVPPLCDHFQVSLLGRSNDLKYYRRWEHNYLGNASFYSAGGLQRNFAVPERLKTVFYFRQVAKSIMQMDFDYYYFHQVETVLPFLGSVRGKKILHMHGLANPLSVSRFQLLRNSHVPKIYLPFFKSVERNVDAIFSVSETNQNIPDELPISRKNIFNYVPVCIDTKSFIPRSREESRHSLGIPETGVVYGYVGRLSKCKGVDRSIAFVANQVKAGKDVRMLVVGDGEHSNSLKQLARNLDVAEKIYFFPAQNYKNLPNYYNAIDVFLMGSEAEGFPMVVLEALSCGVPVLSTDVGSIFRVVKNEENGFILKNFSYSELDSCVDKIINNHKDFSLAARTSAKPYSAEIIAEKIASLLVAMA